MITISTRAKPPKALEIAHNLFSREKNTDISRVIFFCIARWCLFFPRLFWGKAKYKRFVATGMDILLRCACKIARAREEKMDLTPEELPIKFALHPTFELHWSPIHPSNMSGRRYPYILTDLTTVESDPVTGGASIPWLLAFEAKLQGSPKKGNVPLGVFSAVIFATPPIHRAPRLDDCRCLT